MSEDKGGGSGFTRRAELLSASVRLRICMMVCNAVFSSPQRREAADPSRRFSGAARFLRQASVPGTQKFHLCRTPMRCTEAVLPAAAPRCG